MNKVSEDRKSQQPSPLGRLFLAPFCMAVLAGMIAAIVPSTSAGRQHHIPVFLLAFVFLMGNYWAVRDKKSCESAMLMAVAFSVYLGVSAAISVIATMLFGSVLCFFPLPALNVFLFAKHVSWWKAIIVTALTGIVLIMSVK